MIVDSSSPKTFTCTDPTSSVLFDDPRGMPVLTGLDGDMWASQLLTIQTTAPSTDIIFNFRNAPNFVRVERVEIVMFNCRQWGIGVQTIQAFEQDAMVFSVDVDPTVNSCNSLVRLCLPYRTSLSVFTLRFFLFPNTDKVYLAETTFFGNNHNCAPDIVITSQFSSPVTSTSQELLPTVENTTLPHTTLTSHIPKVITKPRSLDTVVIAIVIVVIFLLLLLLVGVVVVVLVLWRCRHQHTAKEEASHTSSQTHTHPVVSLCEETGQVQYVSEQQDTDQDSLYSSIPLQLGQVRKNKDDILHIEMGVYDIIPIGMVKSLEEKEAKQMVNSDNNALLKDVSTASLEIETQFDYTYATVDKKMGGTGNNTCTSLSANEDHLPQLLGKESPEDQLYANTKRVKEEEVSGSLQKPVDQLYAQVDKKKKVKEPTSSPQTPDAQVDEAKEPTSSPETAVDQLYAQVDKKNQKSKENKKEVYPEESGAVYSVVNKPSPPQVPTKSQELLEELATSQC